MKLKDFGTSAYLTAMTGRIIKKDSEDKKDILKESMDIITYMTENIPMNEIRDCNIDRLTRSILESRLDPNITQFVKTSSKSSNDIALECSKTLGDTYGVRQIDKELVKLVIKRQAANK